MGRRKKWKITYEETINDLFCKKIERNNSCPLCGECDDREMIKISCNCYIHKDCFNAHLSSLISTIRCPICQEPLQTYCKECDVFTNHYHF